jgi:hypothetical protein
MLDSRVAIHPHELGAKLWTELLFQQRPVRDELGDHDDSPGGLRQNRAGPLHGQRTSVTCFVVKGQ